MFNLKGFSTLLASWFLIFSLYKNFFKDGGVIFLQEGFFKSGVLGMLSSSFFMSFCLSIGLSVLVFSNYYMPPLEVRSFTWTLLIFIMLMIGLTSSCNMLSMFLGWEGVGVLSFILICWFSSREGAVSGAKKAVLFNRLTDFFFLVLVIWEMGELGPLFLESNGSEHSLNIWNTQAMGLVFLVLVGFFLSSAGKSAQFMFHPWLTAAMEGPTPVSSLLHSSTMVVAGVFLFFFFSPYLETMGSLGNLITKLIMWSSLLTLLGSSAWAFSQTDIKKIVALSTTSQLSMMMVLISLGLSDLAFLHMILHGFFKALIFMGSGVSIHNQQDSQDVRKVSLVQSSPFLGVFFLLGNLGLMGIPFMGASWSKHIILDSLKSQVELSLVILAFTLSFSMTVGYSIKSLQAIYASGSKKNTSPSEKISGSPFLSEIGPTFFLGSMVFVGGGFFIPLFLEGESQMMKSPVQALDLISILLIGGIVLTLLSFSNFLLTFFFSGEILLFSASIIKIMKKMVAGMTFESHLLKSKLKNLSQGSFFSKMSSEGFSALLPHSYGSVKTDLSKWLLFFLVFMMGFGGV